MNLFEVFSSLAIPKGSDRNLLNAISLDEFPFAKVGVSCDGNPVILISSISDGTFLSQKNIRLKYLELTHNLECRVSEGSKIKHENFTVIVFGSHQEHLRHYFLEIAETLIRSLSANPTQKEILDAFRNFVEIFQALSNPPTKTVHGLWSELFIIANSKNPEMLLNYWHSIPAERFDFNADTEKLEVKSSSVLERVHTFTSEQLNPPPNTQTLIASVFVKQYTHGQSILQLANAIQKRVANNDMSEKLFAIISQTLGGTVEQSIEIKFDYELAKKSLRYYRYQDIHKIEKVYIPYKVSEVRFKSDLTELKPINPIEIGSGGPLFSVL